MFRIMRSARHDEKTEHFRRRDARSFCIPRGLFPVTLFPEGPLSGIKDRGTVTGAGENCLSGRQGAPEEKQFRFRPEQVLGSLSSTCPSLLWCTALWCEYALGLCAA